MEIGDKRAYGSFVLSLIVRFIGCGLGGDIPDHEAGKKSDQDCKQQNRAYYFRDPFVFLIERIAEKPAFFHSGLVCPEYLNNLSYVLSAFHFAVSIGKTSEKCNYKEHMTMTLSIRCLEIQNGELSGLPPGINLEEMEGEEIMVCDLDAIFRGKLNLRLYDRVAKFFEVVVVNFPNRVEDLMDSLISGAYSVVLSPEVSPNTIRKMLEVSENIILPSKNQNVGFFLSNGGKYLIAEREVPYNFQKCYNVGHELRGDRYIDVLGFPENLLEYI